MENLPSKDEALKLLEEHIKDDYQVMHAKTVAEVMARYAKKLKEDENLWYVTGLLHDLDYFEFPDEHPKRELLWYEEWGYPKEFIHAVASHGHRITGLEPTSRLACCLLAVDELCGFLYAYSLMRPSGFEGMEPKSVKKKLKDKAFARAIDREGIFFGVEKFAVDFDEHVNFIIGILWELTKS